MNISPFLKRHAEFIRGNKGIAVRNIILALTPGAILSCFIPALLDSSFVLPGSKTIQMLPIYHAINSPSFHDSLVFSVSVSSLLLLELILDAFSSMSKGYYIRWFRVLCLFVPNVILVAAVSPRQLKYAPCILGAQQLTFGYTFYYTLNLFGSHIWGLSSVNGLALVTYLASLIRCYSCFYSLPNYIVFMFYIIAGIILAYNGLRWFYYIYMNFLKEGKLLPNDDYVVTVHICSMFCYFLCSIISLSPFHQDVLHFNATTLSINNYNFTILMVIVSILCDRILRRELASAQQSLEIQRSFIRYISHEMRTPLNAASLGLKLLEDGLSFSEADADKLETVIDVKESFDIAVNTLNELLVFDKLESGMLKLEMENLQPLRFIQDVVKPFQVQARAAGIILVLEDTENLKSLLSHSYILADRNKLSQVVRNLVSNGLKFTPSKNGTGRVTVRLRIKACRPLGAAAASSSGGGYTPFMLRKYSNAVAPFTSGLNVQNSSYNNTNNISTSFYASGSGNNLRKLSTITIHRARSGTPGERDGEQHMNFHGNANNEGSVRNAVEQRDRSVSSNQRDRGISSVGISGGGSGNIALGTRARVGSTYVGGSVVAGDMGNIEEEKEVLQIEVIDTGAGISPENQTKLFKEIIQFSPGKLQGGGGSGLGLYISKGIVEMHHGKISVYSEGEGHGCTFTLELPLYHSNEEQDGVSESENSCVQPDSNSNSNVNVASKQLLEDLSEEVGSTCDSLGMKRYMPEATVKLGESTLEDAESVRRRRRGTQGSGGVCSQCGDDDDEAQDEREESALERGCADVGYDLDEIEVKESDEKQAFERKASLPTPAKDCDVLEERKAKESRAPDKISRHSIRGSTPHQHNHVKRLSNSVNITNVSPSSFSVITRKSINGKRSRVGARMLRILVVDDAPMNRKMLCRFLKTRCEILHEAEDGADALELVKAASDSNIPYDVVLMDNQMPNMTGPEAAAEMRGTGYKGYIIGVTGNTLAPDMTDFICHGADKVLSKPVDVDLLETLLAEIKEL